MGTLPGPLVLACGDGPEVSVTDGRPRGGGHDSPESWWTKILHVVHALHWKSGPAG